MSGVWASLRQTLLAVLLDRYAIVVMVGAVILYSFFYPAAYRHQVAGNLPILVVDEDHSATSRELLRKLDALRVARVVGQPADIDSARRQLEATQFHAGGHRLRMGGDGLLEALARLVQAAIGPLLVALIDQRIAGGLDGIGRPA